MKRRPTAPAVPGPYPLAVYGPFSRSLNRLWKQWAEAIELWKRAVTPEDSDTTFRVAQAIRADLDSLEDEAHRELARRAKFDNQNH